MSLTFTERLSKKIGASPGTLEFRAYGVTLDGSTTTIDASDIGLRHIDSITWSPDTIPSSAVVLGLALHASGRYATLSNSGSSGSIIAVSAWGS